MVIVGAFKNVVVRFESGVQTVYIEKKGKFAVAATIDADVHGVDALLIGDYMYVNGNDDFNLIKLNRGACLISDGKPAFNGSMTTYKE